MLRKKTIPPSRRPLPILPPGFPERSIGALFPGDRLRLTSRLALCLSSGSIISFCVIPCKKLLPFSAPSAVQRSFRRSALLLRRLRRPAGRTAKQIRAVQAAASSSDPALKDGIEKIQKKMQDIYRSLGFTEINRPGLPFDPRLEHAVGTEHVMHGKPGTVYRVVQKGYLFGGRVFRFAQVIVIPE